MHEQKFRDQTVSQTALSRHIHELKSKNIDYEISWKIVGRGREFSPVTNVCTLCDCEKFFILFHPNLADLNKKNEFYSHCMHKKSKLLIKKKRGRPKKSPGWYGLSNLNFYFQFQDLYISVFASVIQHSLKRADYICLKL